MRFLNLWLQIALELLHDCCHLVLPLVVLAVSKLLGAAACGILLSVAAGHSKSYWSGCIKAAIVVCQQIFLKFGVCDFPCYICLNSVLDASKLFFSLWRRDSVLELQFLLPLCTSV